MKFFVVAALLITGPSFAQSCPERKSAFDDFLKRHNPYGASINKATVTTVEQELGKPTAVRSDGNNIVLQYNFDQCQGLVHLASDGMVFLTSVVPGRTMTSEETKRVRIGEMDLRIADLEKQIAGLRAMKKTVQEMAASGESEFVPDGNTQSNSDNPGVSPQVTTAPSTASARTQLGASSIRAQAADEVGSVKQAAASGSDAASDGKTYVGPRGGIYRISPSGRKVYQKRR